MIARPLVGALALSLVLLPLGAPMAAAEDVRPVPADTPPVANAGPDQVVDEDEPVAFDGSASTDDAGIANYTWTFSTGNQTPRRVASLAEVITDAAFDPVRPYVYVANMGNQVVSFVNLVTGAVDETFTYTLRPEALAVTPDGSRLYAAFLTQDHSPYWFDGHEGYVAGFDLATRTQDRYFRIAEDPFGLLATSDGHLVVSSGSGQWTVVKTFDAATGTERGTTVEFVYHQTNIALHPSERYVYGADTALSPSDIERYELYAGGGILYNWDSPYHGDHRMAGDVWVSPRGDVLITRGGDVFTSAVSQSEDMRFVRELTQANVYVEDVGFSIPKRLIAAAEGGPGTANTIRYYDLDTYEEIASHPYGAWVVSVSIRGDRMYAVAVRDGRSEVLTTLLPRITLYGPRPAFTFEDPGTYVVTLTARDAANQTGSDTLTIRVRDRTAPEADAGPDVDTVRDRPIVFSASNSADNGEIADYTWTFDDGGPRTLHGRSAEYTFLEPGTREVTLTVTDAEGNAGSDTLTAVVRDITLVTHDFSPRGFRIGVPEGWLVETDGGQEPLGRVELEAYAVTTGGGAMLRVLSRARAAATSDQDLLDLAEQLIGELVQRFAVIRTRDPEVVPTRNARAAIFEVAMPWTGRTEVWAVVTSAEWSRMWMIVGGAPMFEFDEHRPFLRAAIRSLEVVPRPGPLQDPTLATALLAVIVLTVFAVASVTVSLWRSERRSRGKRPPTPPRSGSDASVGSEGATAPPRG